MEPGSSMISAIRPSQEESAMLSPKANQVSWLECLARTLAFRSLGNWAISLWLVFAVLALPCQSVFGLIRGGEGNSPVADPGWPAGAAAIFNSSARIAWWEGPPFGGGQWHAE